MSNVDFWYPWFPKRYARRTLNLTLEEDGAYRRLIDAYMEAGEPLPDDDGALARLIGIGPEKWSELAPKIRPFFHQKSGRLVHDRCDAELQNQKNLFESYSKRGQHGAKKRWSKNNKIDSPANGKANGLANGAAITKPMAGDSTIHNKTVRNSLLFTEQREFLTCLGTSSARERPACAMGAPASRRASASKTKTPADEARAQIAQGLNPLTGKPIGTDNQTDDKPQEHTTADLDEEIPLTDIQPQE